MSKLSFVIPCYGSETTIEIVVSEIIDTLQKRPEYDYEIILVNDCSPDLVWERIRSLALSSKSFSLILPDVPDVLFLSEAVLCLYHKPHISHR